MATPENYTYRHPLSLHDALPISRSDVLQLRKADSRPGGHCRDPDRAARAQRAVGFHIRTRRRAARRNVSAARPLFVAVDPLSYRDRLFRWLPAADQIGRAHV